MHLGSCRGWREADVRGLLEARGLSPIELEPADEADEAGDERESGERSQLVPGQAGGDAA
jgi:hypothetical protein